MKYRSQVLVIARVLLGGNSCSKENDYGQRITLALSGRGERN